MPMNPRLLRPTGPRGRFRSLRVGLVAYWPMNEVADSGDVTAEDWTGRGNNLTSNNSVPSVTGKTGNGRGFTAANTEWLDATDRADLRFMDGRDWTFAAWLYVPSSWPVGQQAIVSRDGVSAGQRETHAVIATVALVHRITWETGPGTATNASVFVSDQSSAGDRLAVNAWHFLAVTYRESTRTLAMRLNAGTLSGQTSSGTRPVGTPAAGTRPFTLGRRPSGSPDAYLTAFLDEVAKWDRVLSASELDTLWNNGSGIDLRQ